MFVNERSANDKYGNPTVTTIDHERGIELQEVNFHYGEGYFFLRVGKSNILFDASYRFTGENKEIIEYIVRNIGFELPPKFKAHEFSSLQEKLQVANIIEEALKVYGLHHVLLPGKTVQVGFGKDALSFRGQDK